MILSYMSYFDEHSGVTACCSIKYESQFGVQHEKTGKTGVLIYAIIIKRSFPDDSGQEDNYI